MITTSIYVAMSFTIKNCCVPWAEVMFFMDIFSVFESIIKFWEDFWVSASFEIICPEPRGAFVGVLDHDINQADCFRFDFFAVHFFQPPLISATAIGSLTC